MAKQTINLYGEDGITIGLTPDYDICRPDDEDALFLVVGHKAYAAPIEEVEKSIRDAYMFRIGMVWHSYHGWIDKNDPAAKEVW